MKGQLRNSARNRTYEDCFPCISQHNARAPNLLTSSKWGDDQFLQLGRCAPTFRGQDAHSGGSCKRGHGAERGTRSLPRATGQAGGRWAVQSSLGASAGAMLGQWWLILRYCTVAGRQSRELATGDEGFMTSFCPTPHAGAISCLHRCTSATILLLDQGRCSLSIPPRDLLGNFLVLPVLEAVGSLPSACQGHSFTRRILQLGCSWLLEVQNGQSAVQSTRYNLPNSTAVPVVAAEDLSCVSGGVFEQLGGSAAKRQSNAQGDQAGACVGPAPLHSRPRER